jgi:cyclohexanone monooxygenase
VPGFPNYFMLVGPNTGLGHSSMVFVIESQVEYLCGAVRAIRRGAYAAIEPRRDAHDAWNQDLQRRMRRTVWSTGGCSSWYLDEHGRNTTLWPRSTVTLRRRLARFDTDAYDLRAAVPTREDAHA